MRLRKRSIRGRVKGDLEIAFTDEPLTAYGGLELFRRFLTRSGFVSKLEAVFAGRRFDSDYGSLQVRAHDHCASQVDGWPGSVCQACAGQ